MHPLNEVTMVEEIRMRILKVKVRLQQNGNNDPEILTQAQRDE